MKTVSLLLFLISLHHFSFSQERKTQLKYLVHQPSVKSEMPPLLILLHGIGSDEEDLFSLADRLPGKYLIVSVRAPISLAQGGYAWFEVDLSTGTRVINSHQAEESRNKLITFITDLSNELKFDRKKVYLCGFSQGAIMSYSVSLTRPDLVAGIAVMSGRLLEEVRSTIAAKEKLVSLRIFVSHGIQDPVIDIEKARSSVAYLKTLGLSPEYHEYKDVHTINEAMLNDLIVWLNKG